MEDVGDKWLIDGRSVDRGVSLFSVIIHNVCSMICRTTFILMQCNLPFL